MYLNFKEETFVKLMLERALIFKWLTNLDKKRKKPSGSILYVIFKHYYTYVNA
jgi:hypothetical protein